MMITRQYKKYTLKATQVLGQNKEPYPIVRVITTMSQKLVSTSGDDEVLFEGTIKWDGCSDINYGYIHFCDIGTIYNFNKCLMIAHEMAAEVLRNANEYEEIETYDFNDLYQYDQEGFGEEE